MQCQQHSKTQNSCRQKVDHYSNPLRQETPDSMSHPQTCPPSNLPSAPSRMCLLTTPFAASPCCRTRRAQHQKPPSTASPKVYIIPQSPKWLTSGEASQHSSWISISNTTFRRTSSNLEPFNPRRKWPATTPTSASSTPSTKPKATSPSSRTGSTTSRAVPAALPVGAGLRRTVALASSKEKSGERLFLGICF